MGRWILAGLALFLAVEVPGIMIRHGTRLAASPEPGMRARGLALLRSWADRDDLLPLCYSSHPQLCLTAPLFPATSTDEAREVFYRVTGRAFNTFPRPGKRLSSFLDGPQRGNELGGREVGGRVDGVALASSRFEGEVETGASLSCLEWTMNFRNDADEPHEARMEVALPPGGVVSRLTLWVNGEPREAAFAATSQVRAAYESVVVRRRDPVLVTWVGPDRVLVQCFPVPANVGTMQIRLGISAPLVGREGAAPGLRFPALAERNFATDRLRHEVVLTADGPLSGGGLVATTEGRKHHLRGSWTDDELATPEATLLVSSGVAMAQVWARDLREPGQVVVRESRAIPPATVLTVVLDGSVGMAPHFDTVADVLAGLPTEFPVRVLVAGDKVLDATERVRDGESLGGFLAPRAGVGGGDNAAALDQAITEAAADAAVVWIHAAQPVVLRHAAGRFASRSNGPRVVEFAVAPEANRLLGELRDLRLTSYPRRGPVAEDLRALFAELVGTARCGEWTFRREAYDPARHPGESASMVLVRLEVDGRVRKLAHELDDEPRAEAVKLASAYALVTPVTGAVVLETKEQFQRAGLTPVDEADVRTGPEPEFWLVVLVAAAVLGVGWRRRRSRWAAA